MELLIHGQCMCGLDYEPVIEKLSKSYTVYLKAKTKYGKDGILWAANTDEAADKMMSLLEHAQKMVVRSGHDIHYEKPRYFLRAMKKLERLCGETK